MLVTLPAGTRLYRVHSESFAPDAFNRTCCPAPGGGRFDTLDGSYGHLYAGASTSAAIAESLVRRVPLGDGPRYLMRASLAGLLLSALVAEHDIRLVQLHGPGLTCIGQTALLTSCEAAEYARTREWAGRLREWAPEADGFEWRPRHDNDALAYVLYSDRAEDSVAPSGDPLPLDSGPGLALARDALLGHGIVLSR